MVDLTQIIMAVIALIGSVITAYLIPYIKEKVESDKLDNALMWTQIAVQAAEQIYTQSGMGKEKKAAVIDLLASKGFKLDENEIDALIESQVLELKAQLSK